MSGFDSIRQGNCGITFANGVRVSIYFGWGSYTDDADKCYEVRFNGASDNIRNANAEVMITADPTGRMVRWFERRFGTNPAGYLTPKEVADVLRMASNIKEAA